MLKRRRLIPNLKALELPWKSAPKPPVATTRPLTCRDSLAHIAPDGQVVYTPLQLHAIAGQFAGIAWEFYGNQQYVVLVRWQDLGRLPSAFRYPRPIEAVNVVIQ